MADIAPLIRRPVMPNSQEMYREIGVRSFAKGIFHKPPISGLDLGDKRVFSVEPGDLVFNIVFAWEGAVALATNAERGMIGSHRFLTCVVNDDIADSRYLFWWFSHGKGIDQLLRASPGGAGRNRTLGVDRLGAIMVPLPSRDEQRQIVARLETVSTRLTQIQAFREQQQADLKGLLLGAFNRVASGAPKVPLRQVAPLIRRPVALSFETAYAELGVRSFFKGTFHKPSLSALELGAKRIFWIEQGDLIFSNVFAWEGAIAIAKPEDTGRVGSPRFMTCVPLPALTEARFLLQHFQTEEGIAQILEASPGGAGRNRTLGLDALANIEVPVPGIQQQRWFAELHRKVENLLTVQGSIDPLYNAMVPSVLERSFEAA
jgi:type I restriction enzyme S subunit